MSQNDLVVVAGAGGLIGGHLVRSLQQQGHTKIRGREVSYEFKLPGPGG